MTVQELIEALQEAEPDAEVRFMSQPNWPFEISIRGVVANAEIAPVDEDDETETPPCGWCTDDRCEECGGVGRPPINEERDFDGDVAPANRVFLVEGRQLKYGNKDAWNAC